MGERVFNSLFLELVYTGEIDMIVQNLNIQLQDMTKLPLQFYN